MRTILLTTAGLGLVPVGLTIWLVFRMLEHGPLPTFFFALLAIVTFTLWIGMIVAQWMEIISGDERRRTSELHR